MELGFIGAIFTLIISIILFVCFILMLVRLGDINRTLENIEQILKANDIKNTLQNIEKILKFEAFSIKDKQP